MDTLWIPPLGSILSASVLYFFLVFGAGFLCGCIRVPFIQPLLGDRHAQLLEMPVMFVAMWRSANLVVSRLRASAEALGTVASDEKRKKGPQVPKLKYYILGFLALIQILAAEAGLYLWVHWHENKTIGDWITDRDAVAGTVFFGMLGLYALLPAWVAQD